MPGGPSEKLQADVMTRHRGGDCGHCWHRQLISDLLTDPIKGHPQSNHPRQHWSIYPLGNHARWQDSGWCLGNCLRHRWAREGKVDIVEVGHCQSRQVPARRSWGLPVELLDQGGGPAASGVTALREPEPCLGGIGGCELEGKLGPASPRPRAQPNT